MITKWAKDLFVGLLIGVANIIPGVSGGTIALSMGVYDKIISAVTNIFKDFKKSVLTLIPYGIGAVAGIACLSFLIEFMFKVYPMQTSLAFCGLILGGLPSILKKIKGEKITIERAAVFLILFALVAAVPFLGGGRSNASLSISAILVIKLFFVGIVASATMVIPGVSGSMILMLMGYYEPVIETINAFIKAVLSFNIEGIISTCAILIPFGIGILLGIFLIAKIIEWLFLKFKTPTFFGITGLILASPVAVLANVNKAFINPASVIVGILVFILCFYIAMVLSEE